MPTGIDHRTIVGARHTRECYKDQPAAEIDVTIMAHEQTQDVLEIQSTFPNRDACAMVQRRSHCAELDTSCPHMTEAVGLQHETNDRFHSTLHTTKKTHHVEAIETTTTLRLKGIGTPDTTHSRRQGAPATGPPALRTTETFHNLTYLQACTERCQARESLFVNSLVDTWTYLMLNALMGR